MPADPKSFPVRMILVMPDGTQEEFLTKGPKPSSVSGKLNANFGGKLAMRDGTRFQVGCNVTDITDPKPR